MSLQKALCLICERPTADGVIFAVHLDKEKLYTWFLNVCGFELADQVKDEDTICYFFAWQAEFLWKFDSMADESLVWWPRNLDFDDAAKELRKHYFEGNIEQCWVPLEEVDLPGSEEDEIEQDVEEFESETQSNSCSQKKKCLYCGKLYSCSQHLSRHVKKTHKEAIRCKNHSCPTYFHTIEEREEHNIDVHAKPREQKTFKCEFCSKEFKSKSYYWYHVRRVHRGFPVKCTFMGCLSFFKTDIEMRDHFDSLHTNDDAKMIDCEYCEYKTKTKSDLQKHVARKHRKEKPFKCDKCGEMFSTKNSLSNHISFKHAFKRCKICTFDVPVGYFTKHIRKVTCVRCRKQFQCSGLYQSHSKMCRETLLKCSKCPKSFQMPYLLVYHMNRKHGNRDWRGLEHKALGFKCELCKRYYKSAKVLKLHSNRMHNHANLKHCAHCPNRFSSTFNLKNHLAMKHSLLELKFECDECKKQFLSKCLLRSHIMATHLESKTQEKCGVCGKSMLKYCMKYHLLKIHGVY